MLNKAGGGPLHAFCRSSTTFTSALPLSHKFYPYTRVARRNKFWLDLSVRFISFPDHVEQIVLLAPVSPGIFF